MSRVRIPSLAPILLIYFQPFTQTFYGPHVTNQIIKKALHPYPAGLVIVTKLGARRPADGSWQPAISPQDLIDGLHDNLRNLDLDALDIVNYRAMGAIHGPAEGSIAKEVTVLADLKRKGLIRHIGLSNVTAAQVAEAQAITEIVCVQNNYNLAHREDEALIDDLARQGIAYVPFFPLGDSHRCSRPPFRLSRADSEPHRCKSLWRGSCIGRPTCC